jgi:hypothetical protein
MVYVPVYSSISVGLDIRQKMIDLAATVSVRNVSPRYPIVLNFVRYYDSAGTLVREYIKQPAELGPRATVEFVIQRPERQTGRAPTF